MRHLGRIASARRGIALATLHLANPVPMNRLSGSRQGQAVGSPPWSWASAPIWAHVSGYAPPNRGSAGLAFLRAFVDDSAAQKGEDDLHTLKETTVRDISTFTNGIV